jgi:hypothetical protein
MVIPYSLVQTKHYIKTNDYTQAISSGLGITMGESIIAIENFAMKILALFATLSPI